MGNKGLAIINSLALEIILSGWRVSLANLMELSHFVDLYVLQDKVYFEEAALETDSYLIKLSKEDPTFPFEKLEEDEKSFLSNVSEWALEIYNCSSYKFSHESYDYWMSSSTNRKKATIPQSGDFGTPKALLYSCNELERGIRDVIELLGSTKSTIIPSPQTLLPFLDSFHQTETPALKIYKQVVKTHKEEVNKLLELIRPRTVYLPPLLTILLSRCENYKDIPKRLIELRAEFSPFRLEISSWFKEFDDAKTLRDKLEIQVGLDRVIDALTKRFLDRRTSFYKQTSGALISAIEEGDMKGMLTKPVAAFVKEGVTNFLPDKLLIRRFTGIIDLLDKSLDVKSYGDLLSKVFGKSLDISQSEITSAKIYSKNISKQYEAFSTMIS
jgi:hypothetical protein